MKNFYAILGTFLFFVLSGIPAFAQDNTLPTTGNVGIGTLSPSARLDVNGNMKVDSCLHVKDSLLIEDNARIMSDMWVEGETRLDGDTKIEGDLYLPNLAFDSTFTGKFMLIDANGKLIGGGTANDLGTIIYSKQCQPNPLDDVPSPVWNNGLNKIYVDCPPVHVGIGTNTPRSKLDVLGKTYTQTLAVGVEPAQSTGALHVRGVTPPFPDQPVLLIENVTQGQLTQVFRVNGNGLLRSREIRIDAEIWQDRVFEEQYVLMPLSEVENYIKEHKHLPEVPSEKEVLAEGINVAEMDAILIKKIEELTLHLIEQEKRIKELENALSNE